MKEFVISEVKAETAVLVGLITQEQDEAKTKEYLDERKRQTRRDQTIYQAAGRSSRQRSYRRNTACGYGDF